MRGVKPPSVLHGFTVIELVLALFIFTVGALSLAAGSAVVARQLGANRVQSRAERLATSREEIVRSACRIASSGWERDGPIRLEWTVSKPDSTTLSLTGQVTYLTAFGVRNDPIAAIIDCP